MPFILFGVGSLLTGAGIKFFGDGVEDTAKSTRDLAIAGAIGVGVYLVAKKQGVI